MATFNELMQKYVVMESVLSLETKERPFCFVQIWMLCQCVKKADFPLLVQLEVLPTLVDMIFMQLCFLLLPGF